MSAFKLPLAAPARVLACGSLLQNRACLIDGDQVHWSPLHGNLDQTSACRALEASVQMLLARCSAPVQAVAHDLHPDFFSTHLAQQLAQRLQVPALAVQHHHAHAAAVLAEHGLKRSVLGLALDGMGLGSDGHTWGGELLLVDGGWQTHRWRRLAHLQPLPQPGGDAAAREPWRLAAAVLHASGRSAEIETRFAPVVGKQAAAIVRAMLDRDLNCPKSSSAGRWFDAAAAALGLSVKQHEEAEAAMALERQALQGLLDDPAMPSSHQGQALLQLLPVVASLFDIDPADDAAVARGAAWFHLALADGLVQSAANAARESFGRHGQPVQDVVLGGGCLVNQVLAPRLQSGLLKAGLHPHAARANPCGDAGLALGQAWVAACGLAAGAVGRAQAYNFGEVGEANEFDATSQLRPSTPARKAAPILEGVC